MGQREQIDALSKIFDKVDSNKNSTLEYEEIHQA